MHDFRSKHTFVFSRKTWNNVRPWLLGSLFRRLFFAYGLNLWPRGIIIFLAQLCFWLYAYVIDQTTGDSCEWRLLSHLAY